MRVLEITETATAGVGRHVLDLAGGLIARGCDVHLLYSKRRLDESFARRLSSLSRLASHTIDMRRAPHHSDLHALKHIRAYVQEHGPFDVIHGHSSKAGGLARILGSRGRSAIIYTPHCMFTMDPTIRPLVRGAAKWIERLLARRTRALIAVSPEERQHIVALGIPNEKVHVIPNGIGHVSWVERSQARAQLGLPAEATVIGFLGRLETQKDPLLMIRAFASLAGRLPQAWLAVVGTGAWEEAARGSAFDLGVADRISWLGYREPEEAMAAFDIFALPSRYEGFPYVFLEALSAGLPVVTTDVGGARLAVEPGVNGYIADDRSPGSFAAPLAKLVENAELRNQFGACSRERVGRFSIDEMVRQTHALYADLNRADS